MESFFHFFTPPTLPFEDQDLDESEEDRVRYYVIVVLEGGGGGFHLLALAFFGNYFYTVEILKDVTLDSLLQSARLI